MHIQYLLLFMLKLNTCLKSNILYKNYIHIIMIYIYKRRIYIITYTGCSTKR